MTSTSITPTNDVFQMGDRLQMVGVNAVFNPAQMIQFHSLRNRADNELVSPSMCSDIAPTGIAENPIASPSADLVEVSSSGSCPKPTLTNVLAKGGNATIEIDLIPKSISCRNGRRAGLLDFFRGAMPSPSRVVHSTPSATRKWTAATVYRTLLVGASVHTRMLPQWLLEEQGT